MLEGQVFPTTMASGRASTSAATMTTPDHYNVKSLLKKGTYGTIYAAEDTVSGEHVVVKKYRRTSRAMRQARSEFDIGSTLNHPNLLKSFDLYEDAAHIYLCQEYAQGGDLLDYVDRHGPVKSEALLKSIVIQTVKALQYMHEVAGVVHRDVKPDNIVFLDAAPSPGNAAVTDLASWDTLSSSDMDEPHVCLMDFGLSERSSVQGRETVTGYVGSEGFTAPEVVAIRGCPSAEVDGRAADAWSLGITIYALMTGMIPFADATPSNASYAEFCQRMEGETLGAVFHKGYMRGGVSPHLADLLDHLLHPDPAKRGSVSLVLEYMDVPWLDVITPIAGSPTAMNIPHAKSLDMLSGVVHRDHCGGSSMSVDYRSNVKSSLSSMAALFSGSASLFGSSLPLRTSTGA